MFGELYWWFLSCFLMVDLCLMVYGCRLLLLNRWCLMVNGLFFRQHCCLEKDVSPRASTKINREIRYLADDLPVIYTFWEFYAKNGGVQPVKPMGKWINMWENLLCHVHQRAADDHPTVSHPVIPGFFFCCHFWDKHIDLANFYLFSSLFTWTYLNHLEL